MFYQQAHIALWPDFQAECLGFEPLVWPFFVDNIPTFLHIFIKCRNYHLLAKNLTGVVAINIKLNYCQKDGKLNKHHFQLVLVADVQSVKKYSVCLSIHFFLHENRITGQRSVSKSNRSLISAAGTFLYFHACFVLINIVMPDTFFSAIDLYFDTCLNSWSVTADLYLFTTYYSPLQLAITTNLLHFLTI